MSNDHSSGPYDEIFYYIRNNVDSVRDDLALMVSGQCVPAKIQEYAATSQSLRTKEEILSAMVVYGFLSYENGMVSIPNKELMDKFSDMLKKEASLGYVYRLAKASEKMLRATLAGDTKTMEQILELKMDHSPEEAIHQIKEKNYPVRFLGKKQQDGKPQSILLVGIGYDRAKKTHRCKVERVENQEDIRNIMQG